MFHADVNVLADWALKPIIDLSVGAQSSRGGVTGSCGLQTILPATLAQQLRSKKQKNKIKKTQNPKERKTNEKRPDHPTLSIPPRTCMKYELPLFVKIKKDKKYKTSKETVDLKRGRRKRRKSGAKGGKLGEIRGSKSEDGRGKGVEGQHTEDPSIRPSISHRDEGGGGEVWDPALADVEDRGHGQTAAVGVARSKRTSIRKRLATAQSLCLQLFGREDVSRYFLKHGDQPTPYQGQHKLSNHKHIPESDSHFKKMVGGGGRGRSKFNMEKAETG